MLRTKLSGLSLSCFAQKAGDFQSIENLARRMRRALFRTVRRTSSDLRVARAMPFDAHHCDLRINKKKEPPRAPRRFARLGYFPSRLLRYSALRASPLALLGAALKGVLTTLRLVNRRCREEGPLADRREATP